MVREVVGHPVPAGVSRSFGLASPAVASPAREPHRLYDLSKRIIDIILASLLLILTLPLIIVACLGIVLTTRRTPLLLQRRVGRLGREFTMLKLRTMDCEDSPPAFMLAKLPSDQRVTRVGRLLRRTSIDELPQLVNVIVGQMTLVGPRPAFATEVPTLGKSWWRGLSLRPGLTGLWQVSGRSSLPVGSRVALDRCYLARRSFGFDLRILIRTLMAVLSMRGAW